MVLAVGNLLNEGTGSGGAKAITLDSLLKLTTVRCVTCETNRQQHTMLPPFGANDQRQDRAAMRKDPTRYDMAWHDMAYDMACVHAAVTLLQLSPALWTYSYVGQNRPRNQGNCGRCRGRGSPLPARS